jgi:PAS domain S-box-containing protein
MSQATPERRIDEELALREVVADTAVATGEAFYRALVDSLARTLETRGAWVALYDPGAERLRALAFQFAGEWHDDFEYPIAGTACETAVREKRLVHVPDQLLHVYPDDKDPRLPEVVSYLGTPILDENENVLGNLAVVDNRAMPDKQHLVDLFRIFAARASAEMRRLKAESEVREREEKLTRLIGSAMDAIVEVDRDLLITMVNPAAERLMACAEAKVRGKHVEHLLGADAGRELAALAEELEQRTDGDPHLWIPGPFVAEPPGKVPFSAEGTLSRSEADGRSFFTVIVRDVEDRIRAERRIQSLSAQTEYLREEVDEARGFDEIVGESLALRAALEAVAQVAETDATVLIQGKTGTGKELFARAIHMRSKRSEGPLIKVNCAAIPSTLIESEFFGHEKGAFTGATQQRQGRFALADGGTILLDEIGELPLELQGKLLRVLQEGEFEPVGGSKTLHIDVRVLAATNLDLERAVKDGTFREDLYYRLNVFPLRLPPLRERGRDIVLIAENLMQKIATRMGRHHEKLSASAMAALQSYEWPGNVRELRNVIERALITSGGGPVGFDHVLPASPAQVAQFAVEPSSGGRKPILTEDRIRGIERANMIAALEETNWRVGGEGGAAELIGISPSTFKSRMKSLSIRRPD